ncbi:MAG: hypothetical protein CVV54_04255 [Synergistetes bacterium HGW-Synergistetes-1]|nr:MAG: hypothetical protein CVV54_04255 [Synergistetes bacterium HGW-Synergistetes-1]
MSLITPELLTDLLRGSLLPVAGAVGQSAVMIGGEWIKLWQMENAVSVGQKAVEFLKKRGITSKEQLRDITTKFGILYLEGASVEDQSELQELWAKLLANAVDPNFDPTDLSVAFFQIIKGLNPKDAKILEYFHKKILEDGKWLDSASITKEILRKNDYLNNDHLDNRCLLGTDYDLSIYNLLRLQCITIFFPSNNVFVNGKQSVQTGGTDIVKLTPLGVQFIKACIA